MSDVVWKIAHSVESRASLRFAWAYMTNVANWDDPPATFELEGPFTVGARGTTRIPGQELRRWQVAEVNPVQSYVLETELDGATMSFEWRFDGFPGGTRIAQHITLQGPNAAAYVSQVEDAFASTLAAGMTRIVAAIERAETASTSATNHLETD